MDDGGHVHPNNDQAGISLRDHFAIEILKAILTRSRDMNVVVNGKQVGYDVAAYMLADCMLEERKKVRTCEN